MFCSLTRRYALRTVNNCNCLKAISFSPALLKVEKPRAEKKVKRKPKVSKKVKKDNSEKSLPFVDGTENDDSDDEGMVYPGMHQITI